MALMAGAVGFQLSAEQRARLDAASQVDPPYPYYPYLNGQFAERNPPPVPPPRQSTAGVRGPASGCRGGPI